MREILFRAKRKKNGYWIEGGFFEYRSFEGEQIYNISHNGYSNEVYGETAGQYTGLTDKNGTKIFEGDIVHFKTTAYHFKNCRIKYQSCYARYCAIDNKGYEYPMDKTFEYEVVGNIHDNPELLKGGAEE